MIGLNVTALVADAFSQLSRDGHRMQRSLDDLARTSAKASIASFGLNQFCVRENHAQLIVESMEQRPRALGIERGFSAGSLGRAHRRGRHERHVRQACTNRLRSRVRTRRPRRTIWLTPQGIDEDSNAAAGGSQVLDLARRDPVVDRSPADTDHLARFHDAHGLAFHLSCLHKAAYRWLTPRD